MLRCTDTFHVFERQDTFDFHCLRCSRTYFVFPAPSPLPSNYWRDLSLEARSTLRYERLLASLSRISLDVLLDTVKPIRLSNQTFHDAVGSIPSRYPVSFSLFLTPFC